MIHQNSKDHVLIKKIHLQIWSLRDEIESVVKSRLDTPNSDDNQKESFDDLAKEYKQEKSRKEDEEVQEPEEKNINDVMAEGSQDSKEVSEQQNNKEIIHQRRPNISKEKLFSGSTILTEISMDSMFFFCNRDFLIGQSIVIEFTIPKKFVINADVNYCKTYNLKSRIISENSLPYRVAVNFTFLKEGERTLLRNFLTSIEPEKVVVKPKKKENKPADDDFDELDDLGL